MNEFINELVNNFRDILGDNLLCVLLLGSVQKDDTTPFSDIDLVVIIKRFNLVQIRNVRQLLRQSEKLLDLSFLCWDEIPKNPNYFTMGTHGCYQLGLILNRAKCLYGRNVLFDLGEPLKENIRESLLQKIIQYTWWARRMFVESNRDRSLESNYQLNSRLIKMIRGALYLSDQLDIHSKAQETMDCFIDKYSEILSEKEKIILRNIVNQTLISKNSANMSEEYFEIRVSIINKIHQEAIRMFYC